MMRCGRVATPLRLAVSNSFSVARAKSTLASAALLTVTLTACASKPLPDPVVLHDRTPVPVATSCVPKSLGDPPDYADANDKLKAAPGMEDRFQLLTVGREQRMKRLAEVEPVIEACR